MSGDLIGSRISLISRKDLRWEGILVRVDRENASVTLQKVRSWGTEGRLEGSEQIPPADHVHECVNFRGEDIKDLHVHETAEPPVPPPAAAPVAPPPPVPAAAASPTAAKPAAATPEAATPAPVPAQSPSPSTRGGAPDDDAEVGVAGGGGDADVEKEEEERPSPPVMRDQGQKPGRYQPPHKNPNWKPPPTVNRGPPGPGGGAGAGSALPGQGNHLLNRRTRGAGGGPLDEEGEFDFEAGLAKFDKEKEMALLAGGVSAASINDKKKSNYPPLPGSEAQEHGDENGTSPGEAASEGGGASRAGTDGEMVSAVAAASASASTAGVVEEHRSAADGGEIWLEPPVVVKKYNKSSFFDEISCDALDGRGRMPGGRGGERTRNMETFGARSVALTNTSRRYGGRGVGGGYSGYSGNRRGGFNNDDRQGGGGDNGYRGRSFQQATSGGGGGGGGGGSGGAGRAESGGSNWRRT